MYKTHDFERAIHIWIATTIEKREQELKSAL